MNNRAAAQAAALLAAVLLTCGCHQVQESRYKTRYDAQKAMAEKQDGSPESAAAVIMAAETAVPAAPESAAAAAPQAPVTTTAAAAPAAAVPSATPAPAKTPAAGRAAEARKKTKSRNLEIFSETMSFNRETSLAVFERNVRVNSQDISMQADVLRSADYRKSAEAEGNVNVNYKEYGIKIKSRRFSYTNSMGLVKAYDDVVVTKVHDDGNTMTMTADELSFDTEKDLITAIKLKNRVKIKFKDMVAFCDKVVYNDATREMEMSGKPIIKKKKSVFVSEVMVMNVDTKKLDLKQGIWTRVFFKDFEETKREAERETSKNRPSR